MWDQNFCESVLCLEKLWAFVVVAAYIPRLPTPISDNLQASHPSLTNPFPLLEALSTALACCSCRMGL